MTFPFPETDSLCLPGRLGGEPEDVIYAHYQLKCAERNCEPTEKQKFLLKLMAQGDCQRMQSHHPGNGEPIWVIAGTIIENREEACDLYARLGFIPPPFSSWN